MLLTTPQRMLIAYTVSIEFVLCTQRHGTVLTDGSRVCPTYAVNLDADADGVLQRSGFWIGVRSQVTHSAR